jgi:purine-binding chemotaxis protein CheW
MSEPPRHLVFVRGGALHAVCATAVRAVCPAPSVTRVPGAPPAILGLMGWNGRVLPLIDPAPAPAAPAAAVVVRSQGGDLALAADAVHGWDPISPAPAALDPDALYRILRAHVRNHRPAP